MNDLNILHGTVVRPEGCFAGGVEVKDGFSNKELCAKLNRAGLLSLTAGPGLRFLPPLTITKEEMDKGLAILKGALL